MPGIMGTVLHGSANFTSFYSLPDECPHQFDDRLLWIDVNQMINYACFKEYFRSDYNPKSKKWERVEGMSFTVPKFGSTYAMDNLAPNGIGVGDLVPYYHKMIEKFESIGYVDGETLLGAGYDWKELPTDQWIKDVQKLIEEAVRKTGEKAVLITHSMGCPFSYYFLMKMGDAWVEKYIHMYIPMAPAWMGAVKAFDFMLTGIDRDLPIAGKFFAPLMRHIPTLWFLLPWKEAFPNMALATTPSKNYTFDELEDLLNAGNASYVEGKIADARKLFKDFNLYEKCPPVPVRAFVGYGKNTVMRLDFKRDIEPHDPDGVWETCSREMGDGDGTVPSESLNYVTNKWIKAKKDVQVFSYYNMGHLPIVKNADVIEKVLSLFCE